MNKKRIEARLPEAIVALEKTGIAQNRKIVGNYRATISTFGAILVFGDLKSAVAFLGNETDRTDTDRAALLRAMYYILYGEYASVGKILETVYQSADPKGLKQLFTEAAITLKQAMNFFDLGKGGRGNEERKNESQPIV